MQKRTGGRVWYTSDLHLGHQHVAEIRGFESADEHDARLTENWNTVVSMDDTVWVLGDVCLSERHLPKVGLLNGTKHLVTGNHDKVFPGYRDSWKHQRYWMNYFDSVQAYARRRVDGTEFMLSHFPYEGDHRAEQRYPEYRLRDEGKLLVHGHTHDAHRYRPDYPRQVHVGLDAWGLEPVCQEMLVWALRWVDV